MRELQAQIIREMGVKPNMTEEQAREEVERRIQFICDYLEATGSRGLVLGISGGIDSTLAGRLCQLAVDRLNERGRTTEFVAVRLPYRVQHDEEDAQEALRFIQPTEKAVPGQKTPPRHGPHIRIRLAVIQHTHVIAVQERRHRATLNRLNRTERTISPTRRNTLLSQPRNLTIELATGRHVTKR